MTERGTTMLGRIRILEGLLYLIFHDLSGQLRRINLYAQLFIRKLNLHEHAEAAYIEQAVQDLDRLLIDLQVLVECSRPDALTSVADLNDVAHGAISNLKEQIEQSGVTIRIGSLPRVAGLEGPLALVLQNLLSNAIKYRRSDVPLRCEITAADREDEVMVSVTDNGSGFGTDDPLDLLAPFERANHDLAGWGLGLAIVRAIVSAHGGQIKIRSSESGSTVILTLRAAGSASQNAESVPRKPVASETVVQKTLSRSV